MECLALYCGMHSSAFAALTAALLLLSFVPGTSEDSAKDTELWRKDVLDWRAKHAADLQKPDGWLSLAGLEWLAPGENSFGGAADNKIRLAGAPEHLGVLELKDTTVTLKEPPGGFPKDLLVAGAPAKSQVLRHRSEYRQGRRAHDYRDAEYVCDPASRPLRAAREGFEIGSAANVSRTEMV